MSIHLYDIGSLAYLGLPEEEATKKLKADGWQVRVICRDGKIMDIEPGLRGDRVNIEIDKDSIVFEISVG